jgi:protein O-mannosyl-transferase
MEQPGESEAAPAEAAHPGSWFDCAARSRCLHGALPYALLLSTTFAIYLGTLAFGFVWDDAQYVVNNYATYALDWSNARAIWFHTFLSNYAPLHLELLSLIHRFSGLDAFGYHAVQLLLHSLCVCFLYGVLRKVESPKVALLACLWFAVYPPNIETVAWISETKSTLATLFFLISLLCFVRYRERDQSRDGLLCALFLTLSLLSKISTIVAPAIFLAYDYRKGEFPARRNLLLPVCCFLIALIFAGIHLSASRNLRLLTFTAERLRDAAIIAPAAAVADASTGYFGGFATHLLNAPGLLLHYLRMSLAPYRLSAWQMVRIDAAINVHAALAWVGLLGLVLLFFKLPRDLQFWALWFVLFLAPVLQLVPNPTWVADRYLYLPAVGMFVLASSLLYRVLSLTKSGRMRLAGEGAAICLLMALGRQAYHHVGLWRDDLTLWRNTLATCETSAFCHYQVGMAEQYNGVGDPVAQFEKAVQIRPETTYMLALAEALTDQAGDYTRATNLFQAVQRRGGPLSAEVLSSIAKNYYLAGNLSKANQAIAVGLQLNPNISSMLLVEAFTRWKEGDLKAARESLRRALEINHTNPLAARPAVFLNVYWEHPEQVGRLLRDLGPL